MAAGFAAFTTKDSINQAAGRMVVALREAFRLVEIFNAWHAGVGASGLETTYGFTSGDAATIGSATADAAQLRDIYNGDATLGTVKEFAAFHDDLWDLR
jgi:hypothetical protein